MKILGMQQSSQSPPKSHRMLVVSPDTTYVKKVDCCSVEKVVSQLLVSSKEL